MGPGERMGDTGPMWPTVTSNEAVSAPKTQKHKVVLESVTQEKKKLRQVITFNSKPPLGYTFIPAGNPELTTALKEASRKANIPVYTVTTTPHATVHDLSQQVHRMGYHFSSIVVADVCNQYGIQLSASGHVIGESYETFLKGYHKRSAKGSEEEGWDQTTLNTKARDAIKDLFPNIPDNDLYQIIKTAFQKGKRRVGTASELPLARRAQLAVVAHIRHCYTAYDKLLRSGGYHDARGVVEKPTLEKLVEWRGDDENGAKVLEDVFREVVVISDDEDSDDDDYDPEAPLKELSVEVQPRLTNMASNPFQPGHKRVVSGHLGDSVAISDDDAPPGFQYVSRRPKRVENERVSDRRGVARHQVWNAARERFRTNPHRYASASNGIVTQAAPSSIPSFLTIANGHYDDRTATQRGPAQENVRRERHTLPPETIRGADGTIYTRVPTPPHRDSMAVPYDPSRPLIPDHLQHTSSSMPLYNSGRSSRDIYAKERDIAIPSIEKDLSLPHTPERRAGNPERDYTVASGPISSRSYQTDRVIDLTNSSERPTKKRRYDESFRPMGGEENIGPHPSQSRVGYRYEQPVRHLERVEAHGLPGNWRLRGKDAGDNDYRAPQAYPEQRAFGTGPSPNQRFLADSAHRGPLTYPRDPDYAQSGREDYIQRRSVLVPLESVRPLNANDPMSSQVQGGSSLGGGGEARYIHESPSELRYGEHNINRQRLIPYAERSASNLFYGQDMLGSDKAVHRDHQVVTATAPYSGASHVPADTRRVYDAYEQGNEQLPHRMERLVVDHPPQPLLYEEASRVIVPPIHQTYHENSANIQRYPVRAYNPPAPPPLPPQRDMIRGPMQDRY